MTFHQLRLVLQLVDAYLLDDNAFGADRNQILLQVGPLPHEIAKKLESLGVSLKPGILSSGGEITIFT